MKESTVVEAVGATTCRPRNLSAMLRHSVKRSPYKPAVICGDQVVSFEALDRSASALARWLLHQGLQIGDRVAIHWCNSVEVASSISPALEPGLSQSRSTTG